MQISTLGAITIFILVNPMFQGRKWRIFRVMTFVATGLSGFAPLGHGIQMFGFSQMVKQSGMPFYLAEGVLLGIGALVYTVRSFLRHWARSLLTKNRQGFQRGSVPVRSV